ncbi:MAG: serine/threonine-protein phosphatase [Acidobacteriaceae bacterium]|nr:serine/threonine-protein phosphatase [Acidobacteriaceae bacterium]MBV9499550.1 serine/threonine-protein phosphatase [Acidobacteriaceae bacterium]
MLEAFGLSDPGCVRANNEDYFINDTECGIFILADGMGGANAGERASQLSAETLWQRLRDVAHQDGDDVLESAFSEANSRVREEAGTVPELEGMGTTLLVARDIGKSRLQLGSVGDSRAYLVSGGELSVLTEDQTWVAEVGSRLGLSDEALKKHPMRHVLTMAVGTADQLRVFSRMVELQPGDQVLLCSDGLHGVVNEKFLRDTLESEKNLPDKCHYLIDAAKAAGGPDNVTVILIQLT